nr:MAG TPA: hypothetical protein [Caudoviricetes sp.]
MLLFQSAIRGIAPDTTRRASTTRDTKHKLNVLLLLKRLLFQSVVAGIAGGTTSASIHAVRHIYSLSSDRTKCK